MKRNTVILDLDQTIIYGEPVKQFPENLKKKASLFTFYDMDKVYVIFERPHLQEFLDFLFENFNVAVWTAASKDYALFIVKNIILAKPNRTLAFILFSYHCKISEKINKNKHTKYLSLLSSEFNLTAFNKTNTLIIDDYESDVYASQPNNCILAPEFVFRKEGSENDTFLLDLMTKMKPLANSKDVSQLVFSINNTKKVKASSDQNAFEEDHVSQNEDETETTTTDDDE